MGEFSISHITLILIVVLFFFGPSKLPQLGQSMGRAIRGFKDGMNGKEDLPAIQAAQQPQVYQQPEQISKS